MITIDTAAHEPIISATIGETVGESNTINTTSITTITIDKIRAITGATGANNKVTSDIGAAASGETQLERINFQLIAQAEAIEIIQIIIANNILLIVIQQAE